MMSYHQPFNPHTPTYPYPVGTYCVPSLIHDICPIPLPLYSYGTLLP